MGAKTYFYKILWGPWPPWPLVPKLMLGIKNGYVTSSMKNVLINKLLASYHDMCLNVINVHVAISCLAIAIFNLLAN